MSNVDPTNPYGLDPQTAAMLQMILGSSVMGAGTTPNLSMGQYTSLAGLVPQDEDTLDFNRDAMNYFQDILQTGADPMALAFGPGMDQFAPNAFDPLISQSVPDSPALISFNQFLTQPGSLSGLIANRIIDGRDPAQILADLQANYGFDAPDFSDPSIDVLRPYLLYDSDIAGGGTGQPVGINWQSINDEILRVSDMYAQIPRAGESSPTYDQDGNLIDAGGTTSFDIVDTGQVDAAGDPIRQLSVITTTETPSKMAEEFNRLGLPLPTEQFTPEYILGPEQTALQEALGQASGAERAAMDEYLAATEEWRNTPRSGGVPYQQPQAAAVDQGNGINYLGRTTEELRGGEGVTERATDVEGTRYTQDPYVYIPGYEPEQSANALLTNEQVASIIGGTGQGEITADDMLHLANPDTYMDAYDAIGNTFDDPQRNDIIMHALDMADMFGDTPQGRRWREVWHTVRDDQGETAGGGGEEGIVETVGNALDPTVSEALATQARKITDPTEFTNFLTEHADELGSDGLQSLTANAQANADYETGTPAGEQWSRIANSLLEGELPSGGGGGTRVQGYRAQLEADEALSKLRDTGLTRKVRPQDEPPPEPPDTDFLRQLGMEPPPPPVDPNAPVMNAEPPTQGQGPLAPTPIPNEPGRGVGVGDQAAQDLYTRWQMSGLPTLEDYVQQQNAIQQRATQGVPAEAQVPGSWADTQAMWAWLQGDPLGTQYMQPGTHSYWGQNGGGIMPNMYGIQYSNVGPGTTEQEWLYDTGQRVPHVRGPGGWRPFDPYTPPPNVPPSEMIPSTPADQQMMRDWLAGAAPERTDELVNQEQGPEYTQPTPPYVYSGGYRTDTPPYVYSGGYGQTGLEGTPGYVYGGGYVPPTGQQQGQIIGGAQPQAPPGAADDFYSNIVNMLGGQQAPPPQYGPPPGDQLTGGETWRDIFNASAQNTQFDMEADRAQMREVMLRHLREQQEAASVQRGPREYRNPDAERASILNGAPGEDRTGIPASYRNARQRWRNAWLAKQQLMHQTYGADEGWARGVSRNMQEAGITPLSMAMYARTLPMQGAGIQRG